MSSLTQTIVASLTRLLPTLLADPDELNHRLARRHAPSLSRPPRPWCLALRASDTRIAAHGAAPLHPSSCLPFAPHSVHVTSHLLNHLSHPVHLPYGLMSTEVAARLGVSPGTLRTARRLGLLSFEPRPLLAGRRGRPVPMLNRSVTLDPCSRSAFRLADPLWSSLDQYRSYQIPRDLDQVLERRPVYHNQSNDAGAHSSLQFRGYTWLCFGCRKLVRTLYYPLPPITLPELHRSLAAFTMHPSESRISLPPLPTTHNGPRPSPLASNNGQPATPIPSFACYKCHRIRFPSHVDPNDWNHLIAYLTQGLLYGREVPPPEPDRWASPRHPTGVEEASPQWVKGRKRPYRPQASRPAPRRQQVLRRLLNGWTIRQIARDQGTGIRAVLNHVRALCRQEGVLDRHALARKLGSPHPQPLNQDERAEKRRQQLLPLLLQGLSYRQLMKALSTDFSTLNRDTQHLYRKHGVKGYGRQARRNLAQKLGSTTLFSHAQQALSGTPRLTGRRVAPAQAPDARSFQTEPKLNCSADVQLRSCSILC